MKIKYYSIITFLLFVTMLKAQDETSNLSTLSLAVVMPDNAEDLTADQISKLESKITSLVAANGLATDGYNQNFVIYPKFEIYGAQETKGGMRNVTVADCNLSLFIKEAHTGTVFSSYSKSIKGTGFNKNEAIINSLSQIKTEDPAIQSFIAKAKEKIISYYKQNCSNILKKADNERGMKKYESSLAMLLSVPQEAGSCYTQSQAKASSVYKELQQYNCKAYLKDAQAFAAANDYESALQRLSWIDPTVSCGSEAKTLLNQISKEVDDDKKKEWTLLFKEYDGQVEVAKAQAQAMTSITTAWLLNQPKVSYNVIVH